MAPPDVQHLAATYFDTDDLRLIGSHITLRRRTGGDDAGLAHQAPGGRRYPAGGAFPPWPAGADGPGRDRCRGRPVVGRRAAAAGRAAGDRAHVRRLLDEAGQVLAEVADDRVTGSRPDPADPERWRPQDSWREVEVELKEGTPELLDAAAAGLAAAGSQAVPVGLEAGPGPGHGLEDQVLDRPPGRGRGRVRPPELQQHLRRAGQEQPGPDQRPQRRRLHGLAVQRGEHPRARGVHQHPVQCLPGPQPVGGRVSCGDQDGGGRGRQAAGLELALTAALIEIAPGEHAVPAGRRVLGLGRAV